MARGLLLNEASIYPKGVPALSDANRMSSAKPIMLGYICSPGNELTYSAFIMIMLRGLQNVRRFHWERPRRRSEHDWSSGKEAGLN
jgi:hypothetical protein